MEGGILRATIIGKLQLLGLQIILRASQQYSRMIPSQLGNPYGCLVFQFTFPHLLTLAAPSQSQAKPILPFLDTQETIVKLEQEIQKPIPLTPSSTREIDPEVQPVKKHRGRKQPGKKDFRKDKKCPNHQCNKKYSSRIALRAHIRKEHPGWYEETSDYQP